MRARYDDAMSEQEVGCTTFETAIGSCGVAWNSRGLVLLQLPDVSAEATVARMKRNMPDLVEAKPPPAVRAAIKTMTEHLRGKTTDLMSIDLDMSGVPPFHRRVYEASRAIPPGTTLTYGEMAALVGSPKSARAVGQAMGKNPFALIVPCHRIVASGQGPGGFSAPGGLATKARMLAIEGYDLSPPQEKLPLFRAKSRKFGYDADLAIAHLSAKDKRLAKLIDRVGAFEMKLADSDTTFGVLAESIVYQQLTGKAAATIFGRVKAACSPLEPKRMLEVSDEKLRMAGLSGSKLAALKDLAKKSIDGTVPSLAEIAKLDDEAIVERLTQVRGIGRWTVEMLLIFRLGRPDVLPVGDYGVRKGFAKHYKKKELPTPKELEKHGEKWRPFRSVASWYLWRALDTEGGRA